MMKIALHIERIERARSQYQVHGRCIHGPLRVGDRFDHIYSVVLKPDYSTQEKLVSDDVDLIVLGLSTYGKEMDTIDEGLTGTSNKCRLTAG